MSELINNFESDCEIKEAVFDYTTLDTYYELVNGEIVEINKHADIATLKELQRVVEVLNIKQKHIEHNDEVIRQYYQDSIEYLEQINDLKRENRRLKEDTGLFNRLISVFKRVFLLKD